MTRAGVVITLTLSTLTLGYVMAAASFAGGKADRTRCSGNLRQLGLAAVQQADDRRFFPHAGLGPDRLAGGVESNHATRVVRELLWNGYHDNPEGFVCPASDDEAAPLDRGAPLTTWMWDGARGRPHVAPDAPDAPDPTLAETTELSYGWSRRRMNANVRSTSALAADRAVRHESFRDRDAVRSDDPLRGNHLDGPNVLNADGSVLWAPVHDDRMARLTATEGPDAGYLGIADPLRPVVPASRAWWQRLAPGGLALVPFGLAGLVVLLDRRPSARAPRPPRPTRSRRPRSGRVEPVPPDAPPALQEQQRCPYCHDDVAAAATEGLTRCTECAAVFHAECVPVEGACTTLGCAGARQM